MGTVHFITVVWGERFVGLLVDFVLPTQLSPGNLPGYRTQDWTGTYRIFTTTKDAERIRSAPVFQEISRILPVEFILIDDVLGTRKYEAMGDCHRRAIRDANAVGAALVFLSPDAIWSDGTFRRIREHLEAGKRVVAMAGVRVVAETFVPALKERNNPVFPPRDLLALARRHLHPFTKSCFWDSPEFSRWPSNIYWSVGDEGHVARCYHLHPLMVHPTRKDLQPRGTIDDDYLPLACPDFKDWHVVEDSDESVVVDITDAVEFRDMTMAHRADPAEVAFWAVYHARPHHRVLSGRVIRFHDGDRSPAWAEVEAFAGRVMDAVGENLRRPFRHFGPKMLVRSVGMGLKWPLKKLLSRSRIERIRRLLGM